MGYKEGADLAVNFMYPKQHFNRIKNHWRQADPVAALTDAQPGMIASDSADDKLYHFGAAAAAEEVLQATRSIDIIPQFLGVDFWDASLDRHVIKAVQEPGLGGRLTVGLDETARTMIICDYGDTEVDLGLVASADPTLIIYNAATNNKFTLDYNSIISPSFNWWVYGQLVFTGALDLAAGHLFTFDSDANVELTDNNAEQAWMYLEPKIRQTGTANYVGFLMDVTEESLGSGINELMALRVSGADMFTISNTGDVDVIGDFHTTQYIRRDTILWNDCFDHGVLAFKYGWTWDIASLNTQGNGTNTIDTTPSHITLTTSAIGIGDNEGTRTDFAIVLRSRKNRSEIMMELGQTVNTQFYFGWNTSGTNAMNPAADKYVIVFFDVSDNPNWQIKVGNGAAEDVFTSAIAADTNKIAHEIWVETDGTVHWSINGTEIDITGSITKVMQADDYYLIVGQAQSVTGAAAIVAEIDYIENEKYKSH